MVELEPTCSLNENPYFALEIIIMLAIVAVLARCSNVTTTSIVLNITLNKRNKKKTYLENDTYFLRGHVVWPQSDPLVGAEEDINIHFLRFAKSSAG